MSLEKFKKFSSYKESQSVNKNVWLYTRVSTKNQYEKNGSIETQVRAANEFAKNQGYNLTYTFGGTYESAKDDFTRKEFTNMVNEIRTRKEKPFAIMIFKVNRFSRSGSGGISVVHEILDKLNVHLIEISTGIDTTTPRGRNSILEELVRANKENIERLEVTIPGMRNFIRKGNWMGTVPMGYDHYGPRVKDRNRYAEEQTIVLNDVGRKLQQAWKWKLEGMKDYQILKELELIGLKISKQKLSAMWRKPFYCGVNVNAHLQGEVVEGNWEKMVSHEDFFLVQQIINGNHQGYKVAVTHEQRPLTGFVTCERCDTKLTGYEVKKKGVHYYCCQKKCGTFNCETTPRAKKVGLNDSFAEFIRTYELKENLVEVFKIQMRQTIKAIFEDQFSQKANLKSQLTKLESKLEKLEDKYINDTISEDVYLKHGGKIKQQMEDIKTKIGISSVQVSDLNQKVDDCVKLATAISDHWEKQDLQTKVRIQELVFPEGIDINPETREYLTKKVNAIFEQIPGIEGDSDDKKKGQNQNVADLSLEVAKQVKLSNQYIQDFLAVVRIANWIQFRSRYRLG